MIHLQVQQWIGLWFLIMFTINIYGSLRLRDWIFKGSNAKAAPYFGWLFVWSTMLWIGLMLVNMRFD